MEKLQSILENISDVPVFLHQASHLPRLTREEELACAARMDAGDSTAKDELILGYLPYMVAPIRRLDLWLQTPELITQCYKALEKAIGKFNFHQEGDTFSHYLSLWIRQAITSYIAHLHRS